MSIQTNHSPPRIEINAWGETGWPTGAAALALTEAIETMCAPEIAV